MKIFWFLYDVALMVLTSIVIFAYVTTMVNTGLIAFQDYIFIPRFTNIYIGMCAFRLLSKYMKDKLN